MNWNKMELKIDSRTFLCYFNFLMFYYNSTFGSNTAVYTPARSSSYATSGMSLFWGGWVWTSRLSLPIFLKLLVPYLTVLTLGFPSIVWCIWNIFIKSLMYTGPMPLSIRNVSVATILFVDSLRLQEFAMFKRSSCEAF